MNYSLSLRHFSLFLATFALLCGSSVLTFAQEADDAQNQAIAQFELGQNAHERGDLAAAIKFYEKAVELLPEFPEAEYQRGTALQQSKRSAEAEKAYRRAIELRPDWSLPAAKLGALLVQNNNYAEAEKILSKALEIDPNNSPALIALAELYINSKADAERFKILLTKIKTQTDGKANAPAALWSARAALERISGDREAAKASVARGLQSESNNLSARIERAELFLLDNDLARALDDAKFAVNSSPADLQAQLLLSRIYAASGKADESLKILDALGTEQKSLPAVRELRNSIAANTASDTGSIAALEKMLETDAKNAAVLGRLCILTRTVNAQKSLEHCSRVAELEPNNPQHAIGFGAALVQARRFEDAITVLSRTLTVAPDNYTARANLATALYEAKRYAEAVKEYNKLLDVKQDTPVIYFFMATAHDNLGEYVEAMAAYQKFLSLADAKQNQLEIDKVKLRLPTLERQIEKGAGKKKPKT
jgi:tetratricopeptide (TPR) repeat protein